MEVRVWGCRGSVAAPGPATIKYGGNTSCVEVRLASGHLLVLDAGTGIRPLGVALQAAFVPATNGGSRFDGSALLVILVWGVAGVLFAIRRFSWVPRRR